MNETMVTMVGAVCTDPRHHVTESGTMISSFRLVSSERIFDRETQTWKDGERSFVTVTCFRTLAAHVAASVRKGDPIVVLGKLKVRTWHSDDKSGNDVEITANTIGHDLNWGSARFARSGRSRSSGPGTEDGDGQDASATGDSEEPFLPQDASHEEQTAVNAA